MMHACIPGLLQELGHLEQQLQDYAISSACYELCKCIRTCLTHVHAAFGQLDKPRADESAKSYRAYKTVQESCSSSDAYHF